ncbi:unnamed protein product, partial [marine sediment metagenome]
QKEFAPGITLRVHTLALRLIRVWILSLETSFLPLP